MSFTKSELICFYTANIRPVAKYAVPAFHSMIPEYLSDLLEQQQTLALKNIYGVGRSLESMRKEAGLETLKDRRESATKKLTQKSQKNIRF